MTADRSSVGTRAGLFLFLGGTATIGVAYAATILRGTPPAWAAWLLAFGCAATAVGLFVIGAATRGSIPAAVAVTLILLFVLIVASFGAALATAPNEGVDGRLVLGLPMRLAIVFYGVGFVPLIALPVVFGLTFNPRDAAGVGAAHDS